MKTTVQTVGSKTYIVSPNLSLTVEVSEDNVLIHDKQLGCVIELSPGDAKALGRALITGDETQ